MTDGDLTLGEILQLLMGEYFIDKTDAMMGSKHAIIIHNDATAFLPPMLQGIKPVVGKRRYIRRLGTVDTKYAAFLMNTHLRPPKEAAIKPTNRVWGRLGRLLNSGWNCTPTWKGRSLSSTVSIRR